MPTFGIEKNGVYSNNPEWLRKIIPNLEEKLSRVDAVKQPRKTRAIARKLRRYREKLVEIEEALNVCPK